MTYSIEEIILQSLEFLLVPLGPQVLLEQEVRWVEMEFQLRERVLVLLVVQEEYLIL